MLPDYEIVGQVCPTYGLRADYEIVGLVSLTT
jgi:hypothetical protein